MCFGNVVLFELPGSRKLTSCGKINSCAALHHVVFSGYQARRFFSCARRDGRDKSVSLRCNWVFFGRTRGSSAWPVYGKGHDKGLVDASDSSSGRALGRAGAVQGPRLDALTCVLASSQHTVPGQKRGGWRIVCF